jgi:hypothetical protein
MLLRNQLKLAVGLAGLLLAILAAVVLWPRDFLVRQTARETFYIDLPFETVRKILVRTRATEEIMAQGETGELKAFTWSQPPSIGLASFNLFDFEWNVQAKAALEVQTVDEEYVGSHLITLTQDVDIQRDYLNSAILLDQGSPRLRDYENITRFTPHGTQTKVETSLTLGILVTAPNFARGYAAGRVLANADRKVASQVKAIRNVVSAHKDKPLLLFR